MLEEAVGITTFLVLGLGSKMGFHDLISPVEILFIFVAQVPALSLTVAS